MFGTVKLMFCVRICIYFRLAIPVVQDTIFKKRTVAQS